MITALAGRVNRYVLVSSLDVYRAYGVFHRTEPGPAQAMPVDETAELRTRPSLVQDSEQDSIFAERAALSQDELPVTVGRAAGYLAHRTP